MWTLCVASSTSTLVNDSVLFSLRSILTLSCFASAVQPEQTCACRDSGSQTDPRHFTVTRQSSKRSEQEHILGSLRKKRLLRWLNFDRYFRISAKNVPVIRSFPSLETSWLLPFGHHSVKCNCSFHTLTKSCSCSAPLLHCSCLCLSPYLPDFVLTLVYIFWVWLVFVSISLSPRLVRLLRCCFSLFVSGVVGCLIPCFLVFVLLSPKPLLISELFLKCACAARSAKVS